MKSSKVLLKAMDVIATPDKWTKEAYARNSEGVTVPVFDKEAVCFCSLGALDKTGAMLYSKAGTYLIQALPVRKSIPEFNDAKKTTHSDVMEKFMTAYFLAVADGE